MNWKTKDANRVVKSLRSRSVRLILGGTAFLAGNLYESPFAVGQDSTEVQWSQLDVNQDGRLTGNEIQGGWDRYDSDGDKKVTKSEFLAGRKRDSNGGTMPAKSKVDRFNELDITGNGYLTGKELESLNVSAFDRNGDSVISLEEFLAGSSDIPSKPATSQSNPSTTKLPNVPRINNQPSPLPNADRINPNRSLTPAGKAVTNAVQPVLGKVVRGRPLGFFYMSKRWIATGYIENATWYFAPNGHFYVDVITGFSEGELSQHRGHQGTYDVAGKTLTVKWSDGKSSSDELEFTETGFYWETGSYLPIANFANENISGTYSGGSSSTLSGTSAIVSKTLRLNDNGTFVMEGAASFSSQDGPNGPTDRTTPLTGGASSLGGSWRRDGFFLTLTSDSGETKRHLVFPFDDAATPTYPDRLYMSGTMFKKQ